MRPIYTAFYTRNTPYEAEVERLRQSLHSHGLEHDIRAIDSLGGWHENAAHTATHIAGVLKDYPNRPVVQLDADAVVWKYPWLFDELESQGIDVAVHYRRDHELLNGTLWLGPTPGARHVIERYRELVVSQGHNCHNEQRLLQVAIEESVDLIKLHKLGPEMCFIFDIMKDDLKPGESPTIEHLQASRDLNCPGTAAQLARQKRLQEIDGYAVKI